MKDERIFAFVEWHCSGSFLFVAYCERKCSSRSTRIKRHDFPILAAGISPFLASFLSVAICPIPRNSAACSMVKNAAKNNDDSGFNEAKARLNGQSKH